jgi:hypothetical protein
MPQIPHPGRGGAGVIGAGEASALIGEWLFENLRLCGLDAHHWAWTSDDGQTLGITPTPSDPKVWARKRRRENGWRFIVQFILT